MQGKSCELIVRGVDVDSKPPERFKTYRLYRRPQSYRYCSECNNHCCYKSHAVLSTLDPKDKFKVKYKMISNNHKTEPNGLATRFRQVTSRAIVNHIAFNMFGSRCIYLNLKTKKCSIYRSRPLACRVFTCEKTLLDFSLRKQRPILNCESFR